jgi:hypothetical protein
MEPPFLCVYCAMRLPAHLVAFIASTQYDCCLKVVRRLAPKDTNCLLILLPVECQAGHLFCVAGLCIAGNANTPTACHGG